MKTDFSLNHIPPQAIELEESIIASCLLGDAGEVVELLKPDDFYKTAHQKIFSSIRDLADREIKPDLPTVVNALKDEGVHEEVGGAYYLMQIVDTIPLAVNIPHCAKIVRKKAILRALIAHSSEIIKSCYENQQDVDSVIDEAQKRILSIDHQRGQESVTCYRDLSIEAGDRYETLSHQKGGLTGIPSGFHTLDLITCGFQNSDLIIIAARPSMGKTALALNMAGSMGKSGIPVAIFSLEMSKAQLFDRQVATESGVNLQKFRSGKFDPDDWIKIHAAQEKIHGWPVYIDDTAALHCSEIRRRIRRMKKTHGIRIVFIDHLQLIRGDKSFSRDREIGSITSDLKAAAKEMSIPVVLLSQLNRKLEERANPDKRPRISDLRDSGNIEQDADIVAFLYRPEVYEDLNGNPFPGQAEINVAKQRNGPTRMIRLRWHEKTTSFYNPG